MSVLDAHMSVLDAHMSVLDAHLAVRHLVHCHQSQGVGQVSGGLPFETTPTIRIRGA